MTPDPNRDRAIAAALAHNRRAFLGRAGAGLGTLALATLMGESRARADPRLPHFAPRAKRVISLFMSGGPSQLDLFDPKPKLVALDGRPMPEGVTRGQRTAQLTGQPLTIVGSRYRFARHGQSGAVLSELLPHTARIADEIAIVRSMQTDAINHDPAVTVFQTGHSQPGRPTLGAWLSYGLGSESHDLPAFVVFLSGDRDDQPLLTRYWGSGFLPGSHQGVEFRSAGEPVLYLQSPPGMPAEVRRRLLDGARSLNERKLAAVGDPEIAARVAAFEMAFRMQASVPGLMDLGGEPQHVLDLYGAEPGRPSFALNCLLARRLVERGVRFVQLFHRGWDHHAYLTRRMASQCAQTDRAAAALVLDLKRRGLLDETLVIWGGEFGRSPMKQTIINGSRKVEESDYGRDHHMRAFAVWLAGGGVRPGLTLGSTDELGYDVASDPVHVHDLQATILHLLGIDHTRLTYRAQGRDFRLTDVEGKVVDKLVG